MHASLFRFFAFSLFRFFASRRRILCQVLSAHVAVGPTQVLDLTRRTRQLLPRVVLSVTVPHTLPLDEQVGQSRGKSRVSNEWSST